jgi:hypothetical protein
MRLTGGDMTDEERSFGRRGIDKTRAAEWYGMQAKLAMFDEMVKVLRNVMEEIENLEDYKLTRDIPPYQAQEVWDTTMSEACSILAKLDALGEAT